ncbi:MAG: dihydropteroate synthase [Bacteroidetes bacterium]|nr:dihydropteroate synthase [Bacteroidota bacterium]
MLINIKGQLLSLSQPSVMGILNITPDSFFDGGKYTSIDFALKQCEQMAADGATFIDIGGQSTRPGAVQISETEELSRVIPVIEKITQQFPQLILSIDTNKASVAKHAVEAGVSIINDISAGDDDVDMLPMVAQLKVPYIFMHKKGIPETMHINPTYENVTNEVFDYLNHKKQELYQLGIHDIIADIGFGFGKNIHHNFELIANIKQFEMLACPLLVGVSRKSMIYKKLNIAPEEALNGTSVLHTLILTKVNAIIRVHDVKEALQVIKLVQLAST